MANHTFKAIFKKGLLKPLSDLPLNDNEEVVLKIVSPKSIVLESRAMICGKQRYLREIAENEEFSAWNS
ncbi:MAG: DUF104 domain-containing protein [Calditrichaeota bacterium]|nr:MAG: DUF104 domain-containing protein [Calditrichota bacterium]